MVSEIWTSKLWTVRISNCALFENWKTAYSLFGWICHNGVGFWILFVYTLLRRWYKLTIFLGSIFKSFMRQFCELVLLHVMPNAGVVSISWILLQTWSSGFELGFKSLVESGSSSSTLSQSLSGGGVEKRWLITVGILGRIWKWEIKISLFNLLLYLSGLNVMEGILTKNNWLRFPPKPQEAKLN